MLVNFGFFMLFVIIGILITAITCSLCFNDEIRNRWLLLPIIFWVIYFSQEGAEHVENKIPDKVHVHEFVNSKPSDSKISGSFFLFYGNIDTKRYYLVREKLQDGWYKDLEVTGNIFLKEDPSLKDTGKYIVKSRCKFNTYVYTFIWELYRDTPTKPFCQEYRKEILVPENYILKEMNPI